jgi:addiction module RelE/StbE family toxin
MDYDVLFSEEAENDLECIIHYITDELRSPQAAGRFFTTVSRKLELIRDNPYIYPLHHLKQLQLNGYRFAVIGNYLMFYTIEEDQSRAYIIRIVYGKRNLSDI